MPASFQTAAFADEDRAAGIAGRQMRLVREAGVIELGEDELIERPAIHDRGDDVLPPARDAVATAPDPAAQLAIFEDLAAALRAAPEDDERLAGFVRAGVERREARESAGDLPDAEVAERIVVELDEIVVGAVVNKRRAGAGDMLRGHEELRRDRRAEECAERSLILPAAAGERAGRRGRVRVWIAGPEQDNGARRRERERRVAASRSARAQAAKRRGSPVSHREEAERAGTDQRGGQSSISPGRVKSTRANSLVTVSAWIRPRLPTRWRRSPRSSS